GDTSTARVCQQYTPGTCGLICHNSDGNTTFINVLSGFVSPLAGGVRAFGDDLLSMPSYRRARWGLRRTFQTEQAIEVLSVFDNVALVHEHTGGRRSVRRQEVLEAIGFVAWGWIRGGGGRRWAPGSGGWSGWRAGGLGAP